MKKKTKRTKKPRSAAQKAATRKLVARMKKRFNARVHSYKPKHKKHRAPAVVKGFRVESMSGGKWILLGTFPVKNAAIVYGRAYQRIAKHKKLRIVWD